MRGYPQKIVKRDRLKWIQKLVNEKPTVFLESSQTHDTAILFMTQHTIRSVLIAVSYL
jgi:hypothetical protein